MKCPYCSKDVPEGNSFCPSCGQPLNAYQDEPAQPVRLCANCQSVLADGTMFCTVCGTPAGGAGAAETGLGGTPNVTGAYPPPVTPPDEKQPGRSGSAPIIIIAISSVVIVVSIVVIVLWLFVLNPASGGTSSQASTAATASTAAAAATTGSSAASSGNAGSGTASSASATSTSSASSATSTAAASASSASTPAASAPAASASAAASAPSVPSEDPAQKAQRALSSMDGWWNAEFLGSTCLYFTGGTVVIYRTDIPAGTTYRTIAPSDLVRCDNGLPGRFQNQPGFLIPTNVEGDKCLYITDADLNDNGRIDVIAHIEADGSGYLDSQTLTRVDRPDYAQ